MPTEEEIRAANDRAIEAWQNRPRRQRTSLSLRTPDRSRHFNYADQIELLLQEDGHRTWGFVIYRTTYGNDEDWAEFLKRLRLRMEEAFDFDNGRDILDLFTLTVIEDRENLDGASTAAIRERFRQWCTTAKSEQHGGVIGAERAVTRSPRYRYAIQVDAASLHSVVYDAPAPPEPDITKKGWVKLIDPSWQPISAERNIYPFEPIEGVTEKDVGWMKVPYQNVMSQHYGEGRELTWWVTNYQRPPTVIGWPYDDH